MNLNCGLEGKRCRVLYPNGVEKRGHIEFVDDTGNVFIKFRDKTYLGLTADQVRRARV